MIWGRSYIIYVASYDIPCPIWGMSRLSRGWGGNVSRWLEWGRLPSRVGTRCKIVSRRRTYLRIYPGGQEVILLDLIRWSCTNWALWLGHGLGSARITLWLGHGPSHFPQAQIVWGSRSFICDCKRFLHKTCQYASISKIL